MTEDLINEPDETTEEMNAPDIDPVCAEQRKQIEELLMIAASQQQSIDRLIGLVERLISNQSPHKTIGPFEWLPHAQYVTAYPNIVSAITSGLPKQRTLESVLDISKGGGSQWAKASQDWDRLKMSMA